MSTVRLTITPAQTLQQERLRYPGMLPREIIVWRQWLKLHEHEYDHFDYNTRIGQGHDPGPTWPENYRRMAIMNSQKRVDVVGWKGQEPTIIEVKDRAGASAIGQLVTYKPIWVQTFPDLPPPRLALVVNRLQPDILPIIQVAGIQLFIVAADFSELRHDRRAAPFMSRQHKSGIAL